MSAATKPGRRLRRARLALIGVLALAITGSGAVPGAVAASAHSPRLLDLGLTAAGYFAPIARLLQPGATSDALSYGNDGRLTFLLLGSDFRTQRPKNGERTDMIMVLTINPTTGKMAAASIPRDTAYIPLPNGTLYSGRVNELVKKYTATRGRAGGLNEFRKVVAYALKVEIDHVAILRFAGFDALMDVLGPITVTTRPAKDPKLWDRDPVGVYFPAASNWTLVGSPTTAYPYCRGWWWHSPGATSNSGYECHRALMYARTRKGAKNSDFKRQARGVDIVLSAIGKAKAASWDSAKYGQFVEVGQYQSTATAKLSFYSSMPITLANAADMHALLKKANLSSVNRVVFAPTTYSTHISGTSKYRMNVTKVRAWIKNYFKNI